MQTRHTHSFIHQRAATDNGIIHLSNIKASAALDSFDNIYPLLVSEQHPLLYNTMVLSKPIRAILPQTIHIFHASLIRRRPLLCLEKYIINIYMKFKFLSIGGNTVMCNIWSTCVYGRARAQIISIPLQHILPHVASFCFKCHLTSFSNNIQVKPIWFVWFL